jgi:hypothetical protein
MVCRMAAARRRSPSGDWLTITAGTAASPHLHPHPHPQDGEAQIVSCLFSISDHSHLFVK